MTDTEQNASPSEAARKRALERIQKCMRLAKSSEPHEAAAAMRQAQALMRKFSIEENEVHGINVQQVFVLTPEPPKTRFPMYLNALTALICRAFDAEAYFEVGVHRNGRYRQGVRYFVAGGRAPLVEYAHEVIWRQLTQAWKEYVKRRGSTETQLGERSSFWIGWIAAVDSKVMAFGASDKEKEVVRQEVMRVAPDLKQCSTQSIEFNNQATSAGYRAAADFSIHTPMDGESQRRLGND